MEGAESNHVGEQPAGTTPDASAQFIAQLTQVQLPLAVYVRSLMPGDSMANDIAQQANVKIWEKRQDFEPGTNFKAWAFAIARYEVLNYRKRAARDARLVFSGELQEQLASDLAANESNLGQRHDALRACIQTLRPKDQQLLLQRYGSNEPLAEYADRIGRTVNSLKVSLHRLRGKLLECIRTKVQVSEARP